MQDSQELNFLTKKSKYRIQSLGSRDNIIVTSGTFMGYTILGEGVTALTIRLDETHDDLNEHVRLVPTHMIMTVDVVEHVEDDEPDDDESTSRSYL